MANRLIAILALGCCVCVVSAHGATTAKKSSRAGADSTRIARPAAPKAPVRTLDAIRIEGEIDVPQVLFITARDYRRFRDGQGDRYQATSAGVAKSIPRPTRLRMTKAEPE